MNQDLNKLNQASPLNTDSNNEDYSGLTFYNPSEVLNLLRHFKGSGFAKRIIDLLIRLKNFWDKLMYGKSRDSQNKENSSTTNNQSTQDSPDDSDDGGGGD